MRNIHISFLTLCNEKSISSAVAAVRMSVHAQYVIDDNDITENSFESGRSVITFDLGSPVEYYRLKCENPVYPQFSGGESGFKQELLKALKSSVNHGHYAVNGTFDFILNIDKNGNFQKLTLKPDVQNSEVLYSDLNLMFQRMKAVWEPAKCSGLPVDSRLRMRVNFSTDNVEM